jgi:hypothetical protein
LNRPKVTVNNQNISKRRSIMAFKEEIIKTCGPDGKRVYETLTGMAKTFKLQPGKSDRTDVWRAVLMFARKQKYSAGGAHPVHMILNNIWNCESLSYLIVFLTGYVRNIYLYPSLCTGGWSEAKGRRISIPNLVPNMKSIRPPNVSLNGIPNRYSFAAHMWAKIDSVEFDAVTGLFGALVRSSWPVEVPHNRILYSLGLQTYELVQTGKRENGIVEFSLEEVN